MSEDETGEASQAPAPATAATTIWLGRALDEAVAAQQCRRRSRSGGIRGMVRWLNRHPNAHCWLCGRGATTEDPLTVDHVIPVSRGGSNRRSNLKPAHNSCNQRRGDRDPCYDLDPLTFRRHVLRGTPIRKDERT